MRRFRIGTAFGIHLDTGDGKFSINYEVLFSDGRPKLDGGGVPSWIY